MGRRPANWPQRWRTGPAAIRCSPSSCCPVSTMPACCWIHLGSGFHISARGIAGPTSGNHPRSAVRARRSAFGNRETRAARAASVIGPRTSMTLLARGSATPTPDTLRTVASRPLDRRISGCAVAGPEQTLSFHHELLRDAVYADLLLRTRREIHGRVVDAMLAFDDDQQHSLMEEDIAEHCAVTPLVGPRQRAMPTWPHRRRWRAMPMSRLRIFCVPRSPASNTGQREAIARRWHCSFIWQSAIRCSGLAGLTRSLLT